MFIAAEFQLIRSHCLSDFEEFLRGLDIPVPDWDSDDEYRIYDKLDSDIVNGLCARMKSDSIINGYYGLLKLGGIAYDYSETDDELLDKIVNNRAAILNEDTDAPIQDDTPEIRVTVTDAKLFNTNRITANLQNIEDDLNRILTNKNAPTTRNVMHLLQELLSIFAGTDTGSARTAYDNIGYLKRDIQSRTLLELVGTSRTMSYDEFLSTIQTIPDGVYVKVEKSRLQKTVKHTPPPKFTQAELSALFEILTQLDKVKKSI